MAADRAFVYVACGPRQHTLALRRSIAHLRPRTSVPILVVTDTTRNASPVEHDAVVDVRTPSHLDHHQASIFLKTSLHRVLPANLEYAYLDTDIVAVGSNVDAIFDHRSGPVTFARDLTFLGHTVDTFSPWAMNCGCRGAGRLACRHLRDALRSAFGVAVPDAWLNWNGGVFLFGPASARFMDTWHDQTLKIFLDPYWQTRDQGTLISAVWTHGLQEQRCLPQTFNFIAAFANHDLCFDRDAGYTTHPSIPPVWPELLHLFDQPLDRPDWTLARDVEEALERRTRKHASEAAPDARLRQALPAIARRLAGRAAVRPQRTHAVRTIDAVPEALATAPSAERSDHSDVDVPGCPVIFSLPRWTDGDSAVLVDALVRGLHARNRQATVLLTERDAARFRTAEPGVPPPEDLPIVDLPVPPDSSWGTAWGTLVRYLEERSPCVYVPLGDWRHSNVIPQLSQRVAVVGIVRGDDPRGRDEVERLGRYWDGVVTPSAAVADIVGALEPGAADRVSVIPPLSARDADADAIVARYVQTFDRAAHSLATGARQRPRGLLRLPPYQAGGLEVFPLLYSGEVADVGVFPSYRSDYDDYRRAVGDARNAALPEFRSELHRANPVVMGAWTGAGQAIVSALAGELARLGLEGRVLRATAGRHGARALADELTRLSPCIYLLDDQRAHWRVCASLPSDVGIVARVDRLDAAAIRRIARVGRFWNAVVTPDPQVARRLECIDALASARIAVVPEPVTVPDGTALRPLVWDAPMRVAYIPARSGDRGAGRSIARALGAAAASIEMTTVPARGPEQFGQCDVVLMLSRSEGRRRSLVHAMAAGCVPVVLQRNGAVVDLVTDGVNGCLLPDADPGTVAERLRTLARNPAWRRSLAARAFDTIRSGGFDARAVALAYLMLFDQVRRDIEVHLS